MKERTIEEARELYLNCSNFIKHVYQLGMSKTGPANLKYMVRALLSQEGLSFETANPNQLHLATQEAFLCLIRRIALHNMTCKGEGAESLFDKMVEREYLRGDREGLYLDEDFDLTDAASQALIALRSMHYIYKGGQS